MTRRADVVLLGTLGAQMSAEVVVSKEDQRTVGAGKVPYGGKFLRVWIVGDVLGAGEEAAEVFMAATLTRGILDVARGAQIAADFFAAARNAGLELTREHELEEKAWENGE